MYKQKPNEQEGPQGNRGALSSDPKLKGLVKEAEALKVDTFKSAKELELTALQRTALIMTLELMETGGITHDRYINGKKFNMRHWSDVNWFSHNGKNDCGTVCCIGGTASLLVGSKHGQSIFTDPSGRETPTDALNNLFFRWGDYNPTAEEAGKQLRSYLETGKCPNHWADKFAPKKPKK